ncbi:MAG: SDR family oxidoreductase [Gammaproteobacteria bacterium]|nr:SDR family oxidoreductase [Gammaproteobacteria bacterium]
MKNVVITGSTRGIGHGLSLEFLKRDCRVIITGRSQSQVDTQVATLATQFGEERIAGTVCEVTSLHSLQALWDVATGHFGRVDVWINNAGISIKRAPLWEQAETDIEAIVQTNLTGMLLANKVALAGMRKQDGGQIWNMEGFGSGGQTAPGMAAYGCTKSAVTYLIKALQKEIKGSNVQVCTLSPGMVVTDLLVGDYDLESEEWQKSKKILNILGDTVETVTPFLADGILSTNKSGARVVWLTSFKAFKRFLTAGFNKRDLFAHIPGA